MTSMCNIDLVHFAATVLVCLFVSDDFRSGYAKNLFSVRAGRMEYVISKTLVGVVSGVLMLIAPLDAGIMNVILCLAGGVLFSFGVGVVSRQVLRKSDLV